MDVVPFVVRTGSVLHPLLERLTVRRGECLAPQLVEVGSRHHRRLVLLHDPHQLAARLALPRRCEGHRGRKLHPPAHGVRSVCAHGALAGASKLPALALRPFPLYIC